MTKDNPAVIAHVNMMQGIIKRMASNSASCKQWCILIITALVAYSSNVSDADFIRETSIAPLVLFGFLDCYYLGLERQMRALFNKFIEKLNAGENIDKQVFLIGAKRKTEDACERIKACVDKEIGQLVNTISAMFSFSILPFYLGIYVICLCI